MMTTYENEIEINQIKQTRADREKKISEVFLQGEKCEIEFHMRKNWTEPAVG